MLTVNVDFNVCLSGHSFCLYGLHLLIFPIVERIVNIISTLWILITHLRDPKGSSDHTFENYSSKYSLGLPKVLDKFCLFILI